MNKKKLFIENFLVYGLGGIISKIIPLIMVPIVTRLMPNTAYYGISDLANTVVQFGSALAIMGMYDAMYRMFFDKDDLEYQKDICSTAVTFTIFTSVVIFIIMILSKDFISEMFFGNRQYSFLVYVTAISTLVGSTNSIVAAPTRMQNKRKTYLIMNTISPILSYSVSIPLLLGGHYIIALPVAGLVAAFSVEVIFWIQNKKWFEFRRFNSKYLKQLLIIAIPLLPNFLIYWVFNACNRLMITNILGAGETGIYSVGTKLGYASQLIYTAFAGGWQYFAFSTMKEKDQVKTNSNIYEYLAFVSFSCTVFVFSLSYPIYKLLFVGDYIKGYIISPYLFLAPLLQMLFQVACNQFIVIKKTWPNMIILSLGAVINVLLNIVLIPVMGIEGAAIATLAGYSISNIICVYVLCKMKLMIISTRFLLAVFGIVTYILIWRLVMMDYIIISFISAIICTIYFCLLYKKDIMSLVKGIKIRK